MKDFEWMRSNIANGQLNFYFFEVETPQKKWQ
jgi:hypothetical protein